jgi:hypothetical protein
MSKIGFGQGFFASDYHLGISEGTFDNNDLVVLQNSKKIAFNGSVLNTLNKGIFGDDGIRAGYYYHIPNDVGAVYVNTDSFSEDNAESIVYSNNKLTFSTVGMMGLDQTLLYEHSSLNDLDIPQDSIVVYCFQ